MWLDVFLGSYLFGGIDLSLMVFLVVWVDNRNNNFFYGKFIEFFGYDESSYVEIVV